MGLQAASTAVGAAAAAGLAPEVLHPISWSPARALQGVARAARDGGELITCNLATPHPELVRQAAASGVWLQPATVWASRVAPRPEVMVGFTCGKDVMSVRVCLGALPESPHIGGFGSIRRRMVLANLTGHHMRVLQPFVRTVAWRPSPWPLLGASPFTHMCEP